MSWPMIARAPRPKPRRMRAVPDVTGRILQHLGLPRSSVFCSATRPARQGVWRQLSVGGCLPRRQWHRQRPRRRHLSRQRPLLWQSHCLFSQQRMMETPPLFASAQQGLHTLKRDEKSAMASAYHPHCEHSEFSALRFRGDVLGDAQVRQSQGSFTRRPRRQRVSRQCSLRAGLAAGVIEPQRGPHDSALRRACRRGGRSAVQSSGGGSGRS